MLPGWNKTATFRDIQSVAETIQDEDEKKRFLENASTAPGWRNSIRDVDTLARELSTLTDQLNRQRAMNNEAHRRMLGGMGLPEWMLNHAEAPDGDSEKALAAQIAKLQEEYDWSKYFKDQEVMENIDDYVAKAEKAYNDYTHTVAYQAKQSAKQRARAADGMTTEDAWEVDTKEEELRRNLEYYKNLQAYKKDQQTTADNLAEMEKWSMEEQQLLISYVTNRNRDALAEPETKNALERMTQQEVAPLVEKYGKKRVDEIAESYMRDQNQQVARETSEKSQALASDGFWAGAGHSLLSVGANLVGSAISPLGYLVEAGQRTGQYSTLDPNNAGMLPGTYASSVRQTVGDNIRDSWAGDTGAILYDAGMSALDNLTRIVLTGGGAGSLALAATGSFGQTVSSLSQQGVEPMKAVGMGIINGGLEILTEKISLDNLLADLGTSKDLTETLWKMIRAGGVEVTEEELSFLGSTLAEALVLREDSSYNRRIAELQFYGLPEGMAKEQAARGVIDEAFETALQSFLSGGMMEGATSLYSNTMNRIQNKTAEKKLKETVKNAAQQVQQVQQPQENKLGNQPQPEFQKGKPRVTVPQGLMVEKRKVEMAQRISSYTGRQITFYSDNNSRKNGFYDPKTGTIHVNNNGVDPVAQIISHELTHSTEMADAYQELSSLVLKEFQRKGGNLENKRAEIMNSYAHEGHPLNNTAEADSEIVARYIQENLLEDEQSITSLVRENPTLGQRIKNWLNDLLSKFGNTNAQEREFIRKARDAYARALDQTNGVIREQVKSGDRSRKGTQEDTSISSEPSASGAREMLKWAGEAYASGEITEEEYDGFIDAAMREEEELGIDGMVSEDRRFAEKKYSISDTYADEVEQWDREGRSEGEVFVLGSTGDVLQGLGAIESDIYVNGDKVTKILKDHPEMTIDTIKRIPEILDDPVLILKSRNAAGNRQNTRLVIFGSVKAQNGKPVLCALDMRPVEKGLVIDDMQKVTSAYTKTSNPVQFIRNSEVLHADKKRTAPLLQSIGFHVPMEVQRSGSMGSISYSKRNVNIQGVPFEKVFRGKEETFQEHLERMWDEQHREKYHSAEDTTDSNHSRSELEVTKKPLERKETPDKRQYSVSSATVNKRDVARQLQAIIDRGGDSAELQRYVRSLGGGTETGRRGEVQEENAGARQILQAARRQGISVEEHLRQNWELYDVDGEWSADARTALELERRGSRKYSISEKDKGMIADIEQQIRNGATEVHGYQIAGFDEGEPGVRNPSVMIRKPDTGNPVRYELSADTTTEDAIIRRAAEIIAQDYQKNQQAEETEQEEKTESPKKTPEEIRAELPPKAKIYLQRAESTLVNSIGEKMGVPRFARREYLKGIAREISNEYLSTGTVSDDTISLLFDKAYANGVVVDKEFYDQYKHIKDYLRTTSVTISERDQSDIADFGDFRRKAFGTLRIVKEGGLPVDSAYHELNSMCPELFPENITHPADQLQRMYDVGQSVQISQKTLDEYYGEDREEFRRWARNDFDAAVGEIFTELQQVKRFADERAAKETEQVEITEEAAAELYQELKAARKAYEKVNAKNILTEHDEMQVGRLLRGEIQLEHLDPKKDNIKGIKAIYEAKQEYERISKALAAYKHQQKAKHQQRADKLLETADTWKDKRTGIAYSRETMRRNVLDIIPDEAVAEAVLREYFEPVQISEAMSTRFKTEYRDKVRDLNLSQKVQTGNQVSEAYAVQLLGEAMDNIRVMEAAGKRMKTRDGKTLQEWRDVVNNLWMENPGLDKTKIEGAVEEFRRIYDDLFQQMNKVRIRNGYEPVNYRQGYFPHFQPGDGDGIMVHFGKALGIDTGVETLPTTINGMTQTFRPGIQWFGNAQERLGFTTAYDAVQGFDKYIEGVANVIFHTENIQKLRAFATQARYRTSDEGIRKQVDAVQADDRLTMEEKQSKIRDIYEHGKFTLSNFVVEVDEYTNLLAGKKSKYDRTMEAMIGRRAYTIMKNWESRVGANMIAGNITSAFTNFIPLTQAGARLDRGLILKGMQETLNAIRQDDGFAAKSDFLTNRRGSDPITKAWELRSYQAKSKAGAGFYAGMQKTSDIMGLPMELIDNFTSEAIVRAAYRQNIRRGLSENEAMHQADIFAANVMADRSKGSMPTMLESRNPLFKAFTQFQLEVNNQYSEIFKDLPREYKDRGRAAFTMMLLKYFIGAFLFNELYEFFVGRRPALDPLGMLNSAVGDLTGYELPNLVELGANTLKGEETSFETEKVGFGEAGKNLASEALGALPFSAGLTMFGIETDGGRIPAASAIPDFSALWDAATGDMTPQQRWKEVQDELNKLAYIIPPFGGNQISKIWKGVKAVNEGGSYSLNQDGEEILQYPVFNDDPADAFWNMIRATLFGKNALPAAQKWNNAGFNSLNAEQTAAYKDMQEAGTKDEDAYALIDALRNVAVPDDIPDDEKAEKRRELQRELIRSTHISDEGKAIAYYGLVASESERELMDQLADAGADQKGLPEFIMQYKEAGKLKGEEKREALYDAVISSSLTDEEKTIIVGDILGTDMTTEKGNPSQYAKFLSAIEGGLSVDKYMEMYKGDADIDDYLQLRDTGINSDNAADLFIELSKLGPLEGEDRVKWEQQCDVIASSGLSDEEKVAALEIVSYESTGRKIRIGYENGINPDAFIGLKKALPTFDANSNGSYSQKEVTAAIEALSDGDTSLYAVLTGTGRTGLHLNNQQKAVLWQLQTGAKDGKSNPYDKAVGKYIYDMVQKRAEEEKKKNE